MQVNMGAKNHAVIMPDADQEDVIANLIGAAYGGKNLILNNNNF